jgi:hypothetical protein
MSLPPRKDRETRGQNAPPAMLGLSMLQIGNLAACTTYMWVLRAFLSFPTIKYVGQAVMRDLFESFFGPKSTVILIFQVFCSINLKYIGCRDICYPKKIEISIYMYEIDI